VVKINQSFMELNALLASLDGKLKNHRDTAMSVINIRPEDRKRCLGDVIQ